DIGRDRKTWRERFMFIAQSTIELPQHFGSEASGQRSTRQIENIADAFQADAGKTRDRRGREPQCGQWQWRKHVTLVAAGITRRLAIMRGSPGSADGSGNGNRIGKTGSFQPATEIGDQSMLAA